MRSGHRNGFVLIGRLAAGADGSHHLAVDLEWDSSRQSRRAVERQRSEAPAAYLLLDLAAWANEDRRGTRLVYRNAVARDL